MLLRSMTSGAVPVGSGTGDAVGNGSEPVGAGTADSGGETEGATAGKEALCGDELSWLHEAQITAKTRTGAQIRAMGEYYGRNC